MQNILRFSGGLPGVLCILLLVLIASESGFGKPPEWYVSFSKIKLFESTRADVEQAFRSPKILEEKKGGAGLTVDYALKGGRLSVTYSLGQCTEETKFDYNVAEGTVTEIEVSLRKPATLSRFGLDLTKFEMVEIYDVIGLFNYFSEDGGIEMIGSRTELHDILYQPTDEQEALSCANHLSANE